jgi:hypothetical protein
MCSISTQYVTLFAVCVGKVSGEDEQRCNIIIAAQKCYEFLIDLPFEDSITGIRHI